MHRFGKYLWISSLLLAFTQMAFGIEALREEFTDVSALPAQGWIIQNQSSPIGSTSWFQGNNTFSAFSGGADEYIAASFTNVGGPGTISNWLILPATPGLIQDLSFYTRTVVPGVQGEFPDRLEVRFSPTVGTNVGTAATDVGDFTTLLGAINPNLDMNVYPTAWTQFNFTVNGQGRLALRYFVTDVDPSSSNSNGNFIGLDQVVVNTDTAPPPGTITRPECVEGLWFDPATNGQGLNVIFSPNAIVVFFYGYDMAGNRLWLISDARTDVNFPEATPVDFPMSVGSGGLFGDLSGQSLGPWGTLTLTVNADLHSGVAVLSGNDGNQTMNLTKLSNVINVNCTAQ